MSADEHRRVLRTFLLPGSEELVKSRGASGTGLRLGAGMVTGPV